MNENKLDETAIVGDYWSDEQIAHIKRQVIDVKFWGFWSMVKGMVIASISIILIYISMSNYLKGEIINSDFYRKYGPKVVLLGGLLMEILMLSFGLWWTKKAYKSIEKARKIEVLTRQHCLELGKSYNQIKI